MKVDVAIVGGGMVGASLALALRGLGVDVLLVEGVTPGSGAQPSFDDRTTALGNASRRIFESLGVWGTIAPQAAGIKTIHVSDAGRLDSHGCGPRSRGSTRLGTWWPTGSLGRRCGGRCQRCLRKGLRFTCPRGLRILRCRRRGLRLRWLVMVRAASVWRHDFSWRLMGLTLLFVPRLPSKPM